MEIISEELRERYQALSTDELLQIRISSKLTEEAKLLLEEELSKRNVSPNDYEHAIQTQAVLKADRDSVKKDMSRRIRKVVIVLILIAIIGIYVEFIA